MERSQIFDLMSELKLCGMKAAFDDIMTDPASLESAHGSSRALRYAKPKGLRCARGSLRGLSNNTHKRGPFWALTQF